MYTLQLPKDSMLATCSDNHYIYTECCSADPWVTEAMSLLVGSENSPLPIVVMLLDRTSASL